jgi:hypothetical protein
MQLVHYTHGTAGATVRTTVGTTVATTVGADYYTVSRAITTGMQDANSEPRVTERETQTTGHLKASHPTT